MRSTIAAELLLVSCALALPEIGLKKRDRHTQGRTDHVARGILKKRQDTVGTNVFDIESYTTGGAYYANISVGTPGQDQTVIMDTGSSDLYFDASVAPACQNTNPSDPNACKGGTFTPANSHSYEVAVPAPAFNTRFGDGSTASGPFGRDTVCLADICVEDVQFGVAQTVKSTVGFALGLMGVGYSENEATKHHYPNIPEVLVAAGIINSRLYSVYLNDAGAFSGSILFGGIDKDKYTGSLATVDILPDEITGQIDQFISTVTALSTTVGGQKASIFSGGSAGVGAYGRNNPALPVLLDTGSSAWSVPNDYFNAIVQQFPYVDNQGSCACSHASSGDSLTVTFANKIQINVPAQDFIIPLYNATTNEPIEYSQGEQACVFMIIPSQGTGEGFDTLGDAVLRSMYIVYDLDNGQMAIAQSHVNNSGTDNIVTVQAGPGGIAKAVGSGVVSATPQNYTIAPSINATASYAVSTGTTTIGSATGTNAIPADARPSGAANGLLVREWSGAVMTSAFAMAMAAFGMALML